MVSDFNEFSTLYTQGKIHPVDLKKSVSENINKLMTPGRNALAASIKD
jgi:hypothetical protein